MKLLYEGKAKRIYETDNKNEVICEFKDSLTAFNGEKTDEKSGCCVILVSVICSLLSV